MTFVQRIRLKCTSQCCIHSYRCGRSQASWANTRWQWVVVRNEIDFNMKMSKKTEQDEGQGGEARKLFGRHTKSTRPFFHSFLLVFHNTIWSIVFVYSLVRAQTPAPQHASSQLDWKWMGSWDVREMKKGNKETKNCAHWQMVSAMQWYARKNRAKAAVAVAAAAYIKRVSGE